jgi:hypothetical protein
LVKVAFLRFGSARNRFLASKLPPIGVIFRKNREKIFSKKIHVHFGR